MARGFNFLKPRSLVFRLLLLTSAAVILPALVISIAQRSIGSQALKDSIEQQQTELARRIAEQVNGEIRHAQGMVALVARSSLFSAGSRVDQYEGLHNLIHEMPAFQEAMVVNSVGDELIKVSALYPHPRLLRRAVDSSHSFLGSPFFSGNRSPTILIGEPLRSLANPRRTGAILAKMSFTTLGPLLQQASVGPHGVAYIVDERGTLLAHPEEGRVYTHTNLAQLPVIRNWRSQPGRPTVLTEYTGPHGDSLVSLAYPIPLLKSAVVVEQPEADVYAPLVRMRHQFILWSAISVGVFIAIAVLVAWRILQPLGQLRSAAEQVGRGVMDVKIDIRTGDELEELGVTFEKMTQSLRQLERLRRDLISMIVHDLKMPLATILPSLDFLVAGDVGPLTAEQVRFIQMAQRSGQEMLRLIQNLLDVAKMEEGKLRLNRELFLPADLAESVISAFQPAAQAGKKQLRLDIQSPLSPVEGDLQLLSRVLGNLVANALHHTQVGKGEITVALYSEGSQLAVQVRDNGEGIPEEDQQRIFEKFVQSEGRLTPVRTGTGLGLTFCKLVVEAHGGRISVFSKPSQGSLFTFHLPFRNPIQAPSLTSSLDQAIAAPPAAETVS